MTKTKNFLGIILIPSSFKLFTFQIRLFGELCYMQFIRHFDELCYFDELCCGIDKCLISILCLISRVPWTILH